MKIITIIFLLFLSAHALSQMAPKASIGLEKPAIFGDSEYKDLSSGLSGNFRLVELPIGHWLAKKRYESLSNEEKFTADSRILNIDFEFARYGNVSFFAKNLEDTVADNRSNKQLSTFGLQFSLSRLAIINRRKLGVKGISMYPVFGIGRTSYSASNLLNSAISTRKVHGLSLKLALVTNLPFCSIEFGARYLKTASIEAQGLKKAIFAPFVSFKFDSMFDALGLGTSNEGTFQYTETNTSTSRTEYTSGNTTYITTTTTTSTQTTVTSYTRIVHDILIGPTARYTFASQGYKGATRLFGFGAALRMGLYGLDVMADFGTVGYGANVQRSYLNDPFPKDNSLGVNKKNARYAAEGTASIFQARLNVNVLGLFMKLIATLGVQVASGDGDPRQPNAFRINVVAGIGYAILGKPHYLRDAAASEVDAAYNLEPDLWKSSTNDVRLTKSTPMASTGLQFELGAVSVEFGNYFFNKYNAQLGNGNYASIQYTIPIDKTIQTYRKLRKNRKA